jgi:predicted negative regulator of RcsB-dependent stress response
MLKWIKKNPSLIIALVVLLVAFIAAWPQIEASNREQADREAAAKAEQAK